MATKPPTSKKSKRILGCSSTQFERVLTHSFGGWRVNLCALRTTGYCTSEMVSNSTWNVQLHCFSCYQCRNISFQRCVQFFQKATGYPLPKKGVSGCPLETAALRCWWSLGQASASAENICQWLSYRIWGLKTHIPIAREAIHVATLQRMGEVTTSSWPVLQGRLNKLVGSHHQVGLLIDGEDGNATTQTEGTSKQP